MTINIERKGSNMDEEQGFPEWTELGQDSGLDPLGMQRPIEVIYQSLVPGISTITLRYRYYSFFPLILKHYEEKIRHPDPEKFRSFQRRCEALFALICTYGDRELGITGSDWAEKKLAEVVKTLGDNGTLDFTVGADANADEKLRYLRNKGGAFGAIYATQMSEMGLIHFPKLNQPNPNPICSEMALKLADALARELGTTADNFFEIVKAGKIAVSSLEAFTAMRPLQLKPGSEEHSLLKKILLGKSETPSGADLMRRSTLQMLLDVTEVMGKIPPAEDVKWHWFENAGAQTTDDAQVPQLWSLYQACDLMRISYEAILSAALTSLESASRRRRSLGDLTAELAGYLNATGSESWADFAKRLAGGTDAGVARKCAQVIVGPSDPAEKLQSAFLMIAILSDKTVEAASLMEEALGGAEYFQSLRTEMNFLERMRSNSAVEVIKEVIRERVLKRHLWVASRKFRNQKAYTFHMEPEEGVLRYRSTFRPTPSSPRIDQALRFLRDINLIDENGITPLGRAERAAA